MSEAPQFDIPAGVARYVDVRTIQLDPQESTVIDRIARKVGGPLSEEVRNARSAVDYTGYLYGEREGDNLHRFPADLSLLGEISDALRPYARASLLDAARARVFEGVSRRAARAFINRTVAVVTLAETSEE